MNVKSARKYQHTDRLPSESWTPRTWRTREDPFQDVWPQLRDLLERNPGPLAKTLFGDPTATRRALRQSGPSWP
jgi:hypothetical protein